MDESNNYMGWVLGSVATVVATLAAAVTTLWNRSEAKNAKAIEILERAVEKCEKEREALIVRVGRLEERLEHLGVKNLHPPTPHQTDS